MSEAGSRTDPKVVSAPSQASGTDGGLAVGWIAALFAIGMAAIVINVAIFAGGARFDEATIGLGAAAIAMVGALWGMFGIVRALLRPSVALAVESEMPDLGTPRVQLREEKKRVLMAIKELEFDFSMGKLSQADFDKIAEHYKLRAVQVMRRLDEGERHPELQRWLAEAPARIEPDDGATVGPAEPKLEAVVNVCEACAKGNDADAKFCKHCGAVLPEHATAEDA